MSTFRSLNGSSLATFYSITQGDDIEDIIDVKNGGFAKDVSFWHAYFTVKMNWSDPNEFALINTDWIPTQTEGDLGQLVIRVHHTITRALPVGVWAFSLTAINEFGRVVTVMSSEDGGGFEVNPSASSLEG